MSTQLTREQRIEFAQEETLAVLAGAKVPMSAATIAMFCEGLSQVDVAGALHRLEKADVVKAVAGPNGCFLYALALPVAAPEPVAAPAPLKVDPLAPSSPEIARMGRSKEKETKLRNFSNGPFVTIKTPEPAEPEPAAKTRVQSATENFADALGVQVGVMQCSYIAVQIGTLIACLDRPPRQVLADLIAGMDLLRNAGKALELDTNPSH